MKIKYFLFILFIILTFFIFSTNVSASNKTTFMKGSDFNIKIKNLAGDDTSSDGRMTADTNIIHIKRSDNLNITPTDDNIVSTSDSNIPIYVWFDDGTIYYYSESEKIYLNSNSMSMFLNLTKVLDIEFRGIDTSEVTTMKSMFAMCHSITSLDLKEFNTSNVTEMGTMFYEDASLTNLNLTSFDTSNVNRMYGMFYGVKSIETLDIAHFNTSKVTNMQYMFGKCTSLVNLDISNWDVSKVTSFRSMFVGNSYVGDMKLKNLDVSKWNTSSVTDMTCMFYGMGSIEYLDVSNWDVSKVTSFNHMFTDNNKLKSLDLSKWDTRSLKTTQNMFDDAYALETVGDISNWNTSNLIDASGMFNGCTSLENNKTLDLSNWDTRNLKTTGEMFRAVPAKIIDLSGWNLSSITNDGWEGAGEDIYYSYGNDPNWQFHGMGGMFLNMPNLKTIYIGDKFIIPENVNTNRMYEGTTDVELKKLGNYKVSYQDNENSITVIVTSSTKLKDTKPSWTLSSDGYSYSKKFTKNQIYSTTFEDIYGNTKDIDINVTGLFDLTITYEISGSNIIAKVTGNQKLKETKPSWTLSSDGYTYSKVFKKNQEYTTTFESISGVKRSVTLNIELPEVEITYETTKSGAILVKAYSSIGFKDTKSSWNLSSDSKTYKKSYTKNGSYATGFVLSNGAVVNKTLNITNADYFDIKITYQVTGNITKVIVTSSHNFADTKGSWKLSSDSKTYTKDIKNLTPYKTIFTDTSGHQVTVTIGN